MYFALGAAAAGAASSAMDLLSSLSTTKSGASKTTTGVSQQTTSFDIATTIASSSTTQTSGLSNCGQSGALSPQTLNALLAAQDSSQSKRTSRSDALKDLFAQLDTDGNGKISKTEFEDKLGAGGTNLAAADSVFSKLDTDGDGTVSLNELSSALKGKGGGHHRHAHGAGNNQDALLKALEGAQSTSKTGSDGSTVTTLTYADGSKVTMSIPATSSASSSASSSYNLVEQLIQKQADALAASAKQSVSVSV